jgi:hypothetical protein
MNDPAIWLLVLLFGAATGMTDIMASFPDARGRAYLTLPALAYMGLNALAAAATLALVRLFGWTFGADTKIPEQVKWVQVIASGFGAFIHIAGFCAYLPSKKRSYAD